LSEMRVCKRKGMCARNSRMCSGSRRRCGRAETGAGTEAARVAARRSSGSSSVMWGTQVRDSTRSGGRRQGKGVTCGIARKQEVVLIILQRRRATARSSSGRQQAAWRGEEKAVRGRGAAGQVLGRHVAGLRAALERGGARHMAGRAAAAVEQRSRGGRGAEGGRRGLFCDSPKVQGPPGNVLITFKLELK
jgi:hypothetical protein